MTTCTKSITSDTDNTIHPRTLVDNGICISMSEARRFIKLSPEIARFEIWWAKNFKNWSETSKTAAKSAWIERAKNQ